MISGHLGSNLCEELEKIFGVKGGYLEATFNRNEMKIIELKELKELKKLIDEIKKDTTDEFIKAFVKNKSCIALLGGYDTVYVESKDYYIVLNRGKLIVNEVIKSHFGG